MDDLKDSVTKTLEKQGILGRLKAELRASVFKAIGAQDASANLNIASRSETKQRAELLATKQGMLLAALVREYLEWCNMQFTLKVFDPELSCKEAYTGRQQLAQQLGLPAIEEEPLLFSLLRGWQSAEPALQGHKHVELVAPAKVASLPGRLAPLLLEPAAAAAKVAAAEAPVDKVAPALFLAAPRSLDALAKTQDGEGSSSSSSTEWPDPVAHTAASAPGSRSLSKSSSASSTRQGAEAPTPATPEPLVAKEAAASEPQLQPQLQMHTQQKDAADDSLDVSSIMDSIEVESDEDLEGAKVEQDDEFDYTQLLGATTKQPQADSSPPNYSDEFSQQTLSKQESQGNKQPRASDDDCDSNGLSLSSSALSEPGRIRARRRAPSLVTNADEAAMVGAQDAQSLEKTSSGNSDAPHESPTSPKPAKLSPLPLPPAKLGALPPLGALGMKAGGLPPLNEGLPSSLGKSISLDKPRVGAEDIKEELRKAGLLSTESFNSYSPSQSTELHAPLEAEAREDKAEESTLNAAASDHSEESTLDAAASDHSEEDNVATEHSEEDAAASDHSGHSGHSGHGNHSDHTHHCDHSSHSEEDEDEDEDGSISSGSIDLPGMGHKEGKGKEGEQAEAGKPAAAAPAAAKRNAMDAVADAGLTVTSSIDFPDELEAPEGLTSAALLEEDSRQQSWLGRGISLDFRETGLSASDRSGELDMLMSQVDYLEAAENPK